jgi:hypothetical protein
MKQDEVQSLMDDIERSVQMRSMLLQRLNRNEAVDLVEEWNEIEQLDTEIARKIRKQPA